MIYKNVNTLIDSILLTKQELLVLELVSQGYTNEEIAEKLFICERTVITHIRHISEKVFNYSDRIRSTRRVLLVLWYLKNVKNLNIESRKPWLTK